MSRWIEYSISAAVMRAQIAQLSGVMEIHLLLAIFGSVQSAMGPGLISHFTIGLRDTESATTEDGRRLTLLAPLRLATATMLFGLLQERMTWKEHGNPKEKSLLPFWYGAGRPVRMRTVLRCAYCSS